MKMPEGPAAQHVTVERVSSPDQLAEAQALRVRVFVDEQGVPADLEVDDLDTAPTTTHLVLRDHDGAVVATGRLLTDPAHPGEVHVGRVAVDAAWRGTGLGALLMRELEAVALAEHASAGRCRVVLSAQIQASGFYERVGYVVEGPVYLDAGIEHRDAAKTLLDR